MRSCLLALELARFEIRNLDGWLLALELLRFEIRNLGGSHSASHAAPVSQGLFHVQEERFQLFFFLSLPVSCSGRKISAGSFSGLTSWLHSNLRGLIPIAPTAALAAGYPVEVESFSLRGLRIAGA